MRPRYHRGTRHGSPPAFVMRLSAQRLSTGTDTSRLSKLGRCFADHGRATGATQPTSHGLACALSATIALRPAKRPFGILLSEAGQLLLASSWLANGIGCGTTGTDQRTQVRNVVVSGMAGTGALLGAADGLASSCTPISCRSLASSRASTSNRRRTTVWRASPTLAEIGQPQVDARFG